MLKAVKKTRIYEDVVSQIHELIKDGRLKAGDQLPSERELAETFKVSRTSVREALRALETQGLMVTRTGMGTFVADLPVPFQREAGPLRPEVLRRLLAFQDMLTFGGSSLGRRKEELISFHVSAVNQCGY